MNSFKAKLERAQKSFYVKVTALANKLRKEVVIPLCKQHNMCFYSGMGRFFFDKNGEVLTPDYSPKKITKYSLGEVFEIMQMEVVPNRQLGEYVSDYVPPQKRKHYKKLRQKHESNIKRKI